MRKKQNGKVKKLENEEKWRVPQVKMLIFHSFYNKNWSPPRNLRNFNEKTTVIIGFDIKILSPAYDFLKNNDSYIGNFQRKSVFPRQGTKYEAKNAIRTTTTPFAG